MRSTPSLILCGLALTLLALGLLLFFGRFYVLRIYVNRALEWAGIDPVF